jgi:N-acetylglutamate synthase
VIDDRIGDASEGRRPPVGFRVGVRVVVRSLVPGETGPSGGPAMTDVVGVIESVDSEEVTVRRRDGSVRTVPWSLVVAAKVVPPLRSR